MDVETVMNPMLVAAETWESLATLATRLRFNDVGAAAVVADGRLVGIVTERDVVRAMSEGDDPATTAAEDVMTPDPALVYPTTDLKQAAKRMSELGVRHLPVVDDGMVIGMVSIKDVLRALVAAA